MLRLRAHSRLIPRRHDCYGCHGDPRSRNTDDLSDDYGVALARLVYAGSRRGEVQGNLVGRPVSLAAERVEKVRGGLALARRTAVHSNRGKTHAKALLLLSLIHI